MTSPTSSPAAATTTAPAADSTNATPRAFTVWAPAAERGVDLVLDGTRHPMTAGEHGYWEATVEAAAGRRYGYAIDGGDTVPDPRAQRLPDGPHALAEIFDAAAYEWSDDDWQGVELPGSVIYEMHVGTFTESGTFDSARERLDHLVDLGVDIVEVMPVATFPGVYGWGYDGVGLYAVHEPYGGPLAFQRFVDACHDRGLAVALDVVYNHLGPDGNYLNGFGPYFTDRYETPWGWALNLDGAGSDPVRAFVVDNAVQWLRDFHVDALRLDAVHELHDERALPILEELAATVDELEEETGRSMLLIAESDRNDARTVTSREHGGLGIDGQWADDVHHALHAALTGETQGYYGDFAASDVLANLVTTPFLHAGTWSSFRERVHGRPVDIDAVDGSAFVASLQTHDQVGNRREGDRLSQILGFRRLATGAALLLTSPFTPMLFMGEEWAAATPWQYFTDHTDYDLAEAVRQGRRSEFGSHGWSEDSVPDPQDGETVRRSTLDWSERDEGDHERMLSWYRALLALRRARTDLRNGDLGLVRVEVGPTAHSFVIVRGRHRVAVNLGADDVELEVGLPEGPEGVVLLALDPTAANREGSIRLQGDSVAVLGPAADE